MNASWPKKPDFRDNEGLYVKLTIWRVASSNSFVYLRAPLSKFASILYLNERQLVIKPDVNEGLRSSDAKVISPEVMSPETRIMLTEIHSHISQNPKSCCPKFYRAFKLEEK